MTLVACIGGGQLGRMLGLAGLPLGLSFRFLDPSPDACAREVGELVVGEYGDPDALDRLVDGADVVTYEFENVPVEAAERVGAVPGAAALEHGQDRLREKELFRSLGIPTARFGSLRGDGTPGASSSRGGSATTARDSAASTRRRRWGTTRSPRSWCRSIASSRSSASAGGTARRASGRSARTSIATGSCG